MDIWLCDHHTGPFYSCTTNIRLESLSFPARSFCAKKVDVTKRKRRNWLFLSVRNRKQRKTKIKTKKIQRDIHAKRRETIAAKRNGEMIRLCFLTEFLSSQRTRSNCLSKNFPHSFWTISFQVGRDEMIFFSFFQSELWKYAIYWIFVRGNKRFWMEHLFVNTSRDVGRKMSLDSRTHGRRSYSGVTIDGIHDFPVVKLFLLSCYTLLEVKLFHRSYYI